LVVKKLKVRGFVHTLLCSAMFQQLLAAGDRDVVQQVLKWVLAQGQVLEKRAFVGYYLSFPDVSGCSSTTVAGCGCSGNSRIAAI
jgi:hypothetical protein